MVDNIFDFMVTILIFIFVSGLFLCLHLQDMEKIKIQGKNINSLLEDKNLPKNVNYNPETKILTIEINTSELQ